MSFYDDITDQISRFTCSFDETADLHIYIDAKEELAPDKGLAFYAELKLACKAYDRFSFQNMAKPYSFALIYATGYCTKKIKELEQMIYTSDIINYDLDKYQDWILAHESITADEKADFPFWRENAFKPEFYLYQFKTEGSVNPLAEINELETARIIEQLFGIYYNVFESLIKGTLTQEYYMLATCMGKIDYLKFINGTGERKDPIHNTVLRCQKMLTSLGILNEAGFYIAGSSKAQLQVVIRYQAYAKGLEWKALAAALFEETKFAGLKVRDLRTGSGELINSVREIEIRLGIDIQSGLFLSLK